MVIRFKDTQGTAQIRQPHVLSEQDVKRAQVRPGQATPGQDPATSSIAEQIPFKKGQVSGHEFKAAQEPVDERQPKGMHGFLATKQADKKLMPGGPQMEIERNGRLWTNSFWAKGEGIYSPAARFDFDQNGDVRGWMLDGSQVTVQKVPFEGKIDQEILRNNDNPSLLKITTPDGRTLSGKVSVYQDGSIDVKLDNGMTLGTAPHLGEGEGPTTDLVRGPLYGEDPGGAYGHTSRLEFDLDGSVRGWVLDYSETEDIHRDPFKGTWSLDGDQLTLTYTDNGEQKVLTGTVTEDGVTLGDGQDRRFKLGREKNLESFFDA